MDDWQSMRHVTTEENKLRLMYCVQLLGYVTDDQLWLFAAQLDLMDYFSFRLLLDELIRSDALRASDALNGALLITEAGSRMLHTLLGTVPNSDRDRIRDRADSFRKQLEERRAFDGMHELPRGDLHSARITLSEAGEKLMLMRVLSPDSALTSAAVNRVRELAPALLQRMYLLPFEALPCDGAQAVSADAALDKCRESGMPLLAVDANGRFAGAAVLTGEELQCEVLLYLPAAEAAFGWADYAQRHGRELCADIAALLTNGEAAV